MEKRVDWESRILRLTVAGAVLGGLALIGSSELFPHSRAFGTFDSTAGVSVRNRYAEGWTKYKYGSVRPNDVFWVSPESELSMHLRDGSQLHFEGGSWVEFLGYEGKRPMFRVQAKTNHDRGLASAEAPENVKIEKIYSPEWSLKEAGQTRFISPFRSAESLAQPYQGLTDRVYTAMSKAIPLEYVSRIDSSLYTNPFRPDDFVPKLVAPKNAARYPKTAAGKCIEFKWVGMPVIGVQYAIEVSKTPYFTAFKTFEASVNHTKFALKKSVDLWWRVRAHKEGANSFSDVQKISMGYPLPYAQAQVPGVVEKMTEIEACPPGK